MYTSQQNNKQSKQKIEKKTKMNVDELANFWKQFDMILCINLKEDTVRRQTSQAVFNKLQIPVEYLEVTRHPHGGQAGTFDSHQLCMRKAYNAGCENVVLFEDDVEDLRMPSVDALNEVSRFIKNNPNWELLSLGSNPLLYFHTTSAVAEYPHIRKLQTLYGHAYIASRRYMQTCLSYQYAHFLHPIDLLMSLNTQSFAIFPTWFYQPHTPNNVTQTIYRPNWFRKAVINSKNWYAYNVNIKLENVTWVLFALCIVLVILLILVLCKKK